MLPGVSLTGRLVSHNDKEPFVYSWWLLCSNQQFFPCKLRATVLSSFFRDTHQQTSKPAVSQNLTVKVFICTLSPSNFLCMALRRLSKCWDIISLSNTPEGTCDSFKTYSSRFQNTEKQSLFNLGFFKAYVEATFCLDTRKTTKAFDT